MSYIKWRAACRDGVSLSARWQPCRALSPINKPYVLRKHLGVTYLSDMHPVSVDHRQEEEREREREREREHRRVLSLSSPRRERSRPIAELAPRRFRVSFRSNSKRYDQELFSSLTPPSPSPSPSLATTRRQSRISISFRRICSARERDVETARPTASFSLSERSIPDHLSFLRIIRRQPDEITYNFIVNSVLGLWRRFEPRPLSRE